MKESNKEDVVKEEDLFSLKDFLLLCLSQWKWFLLSLIFFVGIGIAMIVRTQPVYNRMMEILVKDQEAGGGVGDVTNAFSTLGLVASNTNVNNELISLTSPSLMFDVVARLDLQMNYNLKKGLHPVTLYGTNNPIIVELPDLDKERSVSFRVVISPDNTYEISRIKEFTPQGEVKHDQVLTGKLDGAGVKSPFGRIVVKHNDSYIVGAQSDGDDLTIDVFRQGLQSTVERYAKLLKGDLTDSDADVIKLSIDDVSKEQGDAILETVVAVYNERWMEDKNKMAVATSKFISERLVVIEKELGNVDSEISDFKSSMGVPDVEIAAKGHVEQGMEISKEVIKAEATLAMTTYLRDYMMDPANRYSIIPMNTGTENPVLEEEIAAYDQLLLKRNALIENSSEDHPYVKDVNQQLAGKRNAILQSINTNIQNLKNSIKSIESAKSQNRQDLQNVPKQAKMLLSAERQQEVMQELYLYLLEKREETELSQTFTADNTRIITPPYGELDPIAPKKKLILIIAFFLGLAVPAGALYLAEAANTKIRSKKDLENLSVPFAGEIPFAGKRKRIRKLLQTKKRKQKEIDRPKVVVAEGKRDIPNEAFRVVRSNIDFMLPKDRSTVLALTSFNPGSGKSFVAFNLGASFCLKGRKVLIIDGDLRHGSISGYVDSPRKGLTSYLTGSTDDWHSLVKSAREFPEMDVMPIGHKPPNPAELLENGRLATLLEEARKEYDVVLVDCPPVNIVVDTQIENQYVDRTLFVVRAGLLEKSALKDISKIVSEDKLKNVTLLLNGTLTEFSSYHTYGNYEAIDKM